MWGILYATLLIITLIHKDGTTFKKSIRKLALVLNHVDNTFPLLEFSAQKHIFSNVLVFGFKLKPGVHLHFKLCLRLCSTMKRTLNYKPKVATGDHNRRKAETASVKHKHYGKQVQRQTEKQRKTRQT